MIFFYYIELLVSSNKARHKTTIVASITAQSLQQILNFLLSLAGPISVSQKLVVQVYLASQ